MSFSRKMLKRVGGGRQPHLTPAIILSHSLALTVIWIALVALSYSCSIVRTKFALKLYFRTGVRLHTILN